MAIAFDTASGTLATGGGVTSINWNHTASGLNRVSVITIYQDGSTSDMVTGVTYGGVSATRINTIAGAGGSPNSRIYMYMFLAPPTSSTNIVVSLSGTVNQLGGSSLSYTGVKQSLTPDSQNTSTTTDTSSYSVSTTVVATGCWLVGASRNNDAVPSAGAGTTIRDTQNTMVASDSNGTVATGSRSLAWTGVAATADWVGSILSLEPVPPTNIKTVNGLAYASVKTFDGLATGSVKTINGLQ